MIIAFDLDGTLIDSARDLGDAVSELVQSYGARDLIWKTALVGGLVSASVQVGRLTLPAPAASCVR